MSHRIIHFENGSDDVEAGGDGGERFSHSRVISIVLGVAGAMLLLFGTRWLNSVDNDIQSLKIAVERLAVSQAEANTKLNFILQGRKSNGI